MPEVKEFEVETTTKTREIMVPDFSNVSATKIIEDLQKKTLRQREYRPERPYLADFLYPSIGLWPSYQWPVWYRTPATPQLPSIKKVIFNAPATIVFWGDGSKTIVKCQPGDTFSPETGLAMAIAKKVYGNKGNYNNIFRKWVPKDE